MVIQLDVLERHSLQGIVAYKPIKSIQKLPSLATEITQKYWRVYWRPILQHELFDTVGSYCYCQQTAFKSNYAEEKNFAWLPCTYYRIWCIYMAQSFCRVYSYTRIHVATDTSCIHLYPLVAVHTFLVSATKLSPVCCLTQRDTSRPWHKWIVIMSPRYSQHSTSIPDEQLVSGDMIVFVDMYVSGYKLLVRDTCFRATCGIILGSEALTFSGPVFADTGL